jgi:hypothetical protein
MLPQDCIEVLAHQRRQPQQLPADALHQGNGFRSRSGGDSAAAAALIMV